jgi:nicotinamide riboside kinase
VERTTAEHRRPDLYLLTDVSTPFVHDGTRDGEHVREWMHRTFVEELRAQGRPFRPLSGTHDERMREAVAHIDRLLGAGRPA